MTHVADSYDTRFMAVDSPWRATPNGIVRAVAVGGGEDWRGCGDGCEGCAGRWRSPSAFRGIFWIRSSREFDFGWN